MIKIKKLRNTIIVICVLILIPTVLSIGVLYLGIPKGKYGTPQIKELVKDNKAEVIEVNKKMSIDDDTLLIRRIIITEDKTYLRYTYFYEEMGWSFNNYSLTIYDDKNREYKCNSNGSAGLIIGEDGTMGFEKIEAGFNELTLKYNLYNREYEINLLEGVFNE